MQQLATFALALIVGVGCGTNVDLGGTSDAAASTPATLGGECAPCTRTRECVPGAACAVFAGDLFCATLCTTSDDCPSGQSCWTVKAATGEKIRACTPTSDVCEPAPPPAGDDGGAKLQCGALNGPSVRSECHACGAYSSDCQPNGCYGGWWCNTVSRDCQPPPRTCF